MADIQDELRKATEGLLYISESDAPWEPFVWKPEGQAGAPTPNKANAKLIVNVSSDAPAEVIPFADFFVPLTAEEDWYGPEEKAEAARYRQLKQTLASLLTDLKVFKLGSRRVEVVIAGKTPHGQLAGVKTQAVET